MLTLPEIKIFKKQSMTYQKKETMKLWNLAYPIYFLYYLNDLIFFYLSEE